MDDITWNLQTKTDASRALESLNLDEREPL